MTNLLTDEVIAPLKEKTQEAYSTVETPIGKWIDGSTLYRKVVPVSPSAITGETSIIQTGIISANLMIKMYGWCQAKNNGYLMTIPMTTGGWTIDVHDYARAGTVKMAVSENQRNRGFDSIYLIFEYTR